MVPSCLRQNIFTQGLSCGSSLMGGHMGEPVDLVGGPCEPCGGLVGLVGVVWVLRWRLVGLVGSPVGHVGCHVI